MAKGTSKGRSAGPRVAKPTSRSTVNASKITQATSTALLASGVACLVASAVWTSWFPPAQQWRPEDAQRLAALTDEANSLYKKFAQARLRGIEIPDDPIPLRKIKQEIAATRGRLQEAAALPVKQAFQLKWIGIGLVIGGLCGLAATRQLSRSKRGP